MILIAFDPPKSLSAEQKVWWERWSKRSGSAMQKALAEGKSHKFNEKIWKDLKEWLLDNVFSKKCAYCEFDYVAAAYGDAEHYRPKGGVEFAGKPVIVDGHDHPGYYWIAYHWKNILPSCQKCNSGDGKQTKFGVRKSHSIDNKLDPDQLDLIEDPMLLHPYRDNPSDYLIFGEFGTVAAKDENERGSFTIDTCQLRRPALVTSRRSAQEAGWLKYLALMQAGNVKDFAEWVLKERHSGAIIQYVKRKHDESRPNF